MKLKVRCQRCKEEFSLKKVYFTRPEMIDALGEYFRLKCTLCQSTNEYHANDVVAKQGRTAKTAVIVLGVLFMIISTVLILMVGYISLFGYAIGALIINTGLGNTNSSSLKVFNSYKITRNLKVDP